LTEWKQYGAGARDLQLEGESLRVSLGGGQHLVDVKAASDGFELSAVVARRSIVNVLEQVALAAWVRNRASNLVGFRIDNRGRLVGESWVPGAGLTRDEFLFHVRNLAAACDLFEFQLTGRDRE
jgi:hypothetical protein